MLLILTAGQKRVIARFSNNINKCLFQYWTPGKNATPVLKKDVTCNGNSQIGLCYGANKKMSQYAACYNQKTLIPDFTGHIVRPNIGGQGRGDTVFRADAGVGNIFTTLIHDS